MARTATTRQRTPLPATQFPATQKVKLEKPTITKENVRHRAYELYLKRGTTPGDEVGDWLQAERELRAN